MRHTIIACVLTASLGGGVQAQQGGPARNDISQHINSAAADKQNEQSRAGSDAAVRTVLTAAGELAKTELEKAKNPPDAGRLAADEKHMADALQNLSPEGKALLAQNNASAPAGGAPADPAGPKPTPIKPEPLTPPAPAQPQPPTIITGDTTYFDSSNSIAVFLGNVVVDSPQFHITCDEFEVHMKKEEKDKDKPKPGAVDSSGKPIPPAPPPEPPKPDLKTLAVTAPATLPGSAAPAKPPAPDNGIELAIAKGRLVVIVKHNPDGKIQIGQSRHAVYEGSTGDITLRESPQVQDGDDLHISLEPTTVMVMTQAGKLNTTGRSTTKLIQAPAASTTNAKTPAAGAAAGKTPATTPAAGTPSAGGAVKTSKGLSIPAPGPGQ